MISVNIFFYRYAAFDKKVLKKILVREPTKKKSGVSFLSVFKKLAEEDISTFVEHGGTKSFGSNLFLTPSYASLYRATLNTSQRFDVLIFNLDYRLHMPSLYNRKQS